MTILAFDIGNTNTSIGIFRGKSMLSHWETPTRRRTGLRYWKELVSLCCIEAGIGPGDITRSVISSVVPEVTGDVAAAVRKYGGAAPLVVTGSLPLGVRTRYESPDMLGPDRACAVAAAWRRYRGPVIVVDCGTAITFDAVSRSGVHMGGLISPGLTISAEALSAGTAALPRAESSGHADLIGKNTAGSIRAGILYGVAGGIREITGRVKKTLGGGATVVGCGGDAAGLQEEFSLFDIVHRNIVLEGACIILRNTIRRAARKKSSRVTSSRPGASR